MHFKIKIFEKGRKLYEVRTHKIRRIFKKARTIKWSESLLEVYFEVVYGKSLDVYGKMTKDYNDGYYDNEPEFWLAINAFLEIEGGE